MLYTISAFLLCVAQDPPVGLTESELSVVRNLLGRREQQQWLKNIVCEEGRQLLKRSELVSIIIDVQGSWRHRTHSEMRLEGLLQGKTTDGPQLRSELQRDEIYKQVLALHLALVKSAVQPREAGQRVMLAWDAVEKQASPGDKDALWGMIGGYTHALHPGTRTELLQDKDFGQNARLALLKYEYFERKKLDTLNNQQWKPDVAPDDSWTIPGVLKDPLQLQRSLKQGSPKFRAGSCNAYPLKTDAGNTIYLLVEDDVTRTLLESPSSQAWADALKTGKARVFYGQDGKADLFATDPKRITRTLQGLKPE
jgi:hypothetical protein